MSNRRKAEANRDAADKIAAKIDTVKDDPQRDPDYWVPKIKGRWSQSVASIIDTGKLLIEAKEHLSPGNWGKVYHRAGFSKRMAQYLINIAKCPHFTEANHGSLPTSWTTLRELAKLDAKGFSRALKDGKIQPNMLRKHVADYQPPDADTPEEESAPKAEPAKAKAAKAKAAKAERGTSRQSEQIASTQEDDASDRGAPAHDLDKVREIQRLAADDDEEAAKEAALEYVLAVELDDGEEYQCELEADRHNATHASP